MAIGFVYAYKYLDRQVFFAENLILNNWRNAMNKKLTSCVIFGIFFLFLSFSIVFSQGDNTQDPLVNLGCLDEAIVTGSVDTSLSGGKLPDDILWNPATNDYKTESSWHEYGLGYNEIMGDVTEENPVWWMVEWPTAKNINYITVTGTYGNQPQPHTGWAIQMDSAGTWVNIAKADNGWPEDSLKGVGGWVNDGLLELKLMEPIITSKIRFTAYANPDSLADGVETFADSLWSFSWTGLKKSSSSPYACLIQYLDFSGETAKNRMDANTNLAILDEAVVSGRYDYNEIQNLRGHPMDMLWDPKTGDFHNNDSWWGEYGAPYASDLGYVTRDGQGDLQPFYWMVEWVTPKNVNYFSWGGCYGNQPQPFTPWAVEYYDGSAWVELASGFGTDRDAGSYLYDSAGRIYGFNGMGVDSTTNSVWQSDEPVVATKIRLLVWSDGIDPLYSFHVRGRGGRTRNWDETVWIRGYDPVGYVSNSSETEAGLGGYWVNGEGGNADPIPSTFKAMLVQYKAITAIEEGVNVYKPTDFALYQNYPNPFNPQTTIKYAVKTASQVRLAVYNVLGQEVTVLVDETKQIGIHSVVFDASKLSSGIYYYQLNTGQGSFTKKMMVIK